MVTRVFPLPTAAPADDELEQLLTAEDVAKLFSVPLSWIYRGTHRPKDPVPHYKIGKYTRFSEREVREWLRRNRG